MDCCNANEGIINDHNCLDGHSKLTSLHAKSEDKIIQSSMSYNNLMNQVEPSTSSEESEADKLIQENNKLREQNLKLQKILAIAGVKFDGENEISGASQQLVTCTPASSTFSSDIQDLNVSGGCQLSNGDDDYSLNSNNVECSTDAIVNGNKSKRADDDHHGGSEVLLCDTSTNVEFAPIQEEQCTESELFAELQVDTTVDIIAKSNSFEDQGLTISLTGHSDEANIKINTQLSRPGMSYLNPDGIVDISPPLPMSDHSFSGSRAVTPNVSAITSASTTTSFTAANPVSQTSNLFSHHPSLSMSSGTPILNLQRLDTGVQLGGPLSLMGGFNNGILINQLGQQVSFLSQQQQPSNILLNSNQGLMASQTKLLSPNANILPQNGGLIAHQGNLLMSNGNGIFQQFAQPVSNLNLIPQAAPLFTGNQMKTTPMHGPMTLNVVPQNSSRDFLMLPNGKLVPISTQPSILPVTPSHPAMQSIITGFPNQIRLQSPQFLGSNSIQRCSQSFSLLPNQIPILAPSDQSRLTGQNQISVNGLPVLAPGQLPQALQIFNQLPQVSPQQNINNPSLNAPHAVIPPQNFVLPSIQPCMTAYLTPEGTIVLSLHQQNSKKVSDDSQKSSQSSNNNFLQEKKVQRRIMPKPSSNDSILNPSLSAVVSSNSAISCHITVSSSTTDNIDGSDKVNNSGTHQTLFQSNDFLKKNQQNFENSEPFTHIHEDISVKKKGSGRKRESGGTEKKKRPKPIVQKIESGCNDRVANVTLPSNEKTDLTDLQDISCCMLNESLNDQFSQNLNDDDQGDINQFSDLIVMDNEVTSNPKNTLEENILVAANCEIKDSDNPFQCESLTESTSTFSVSSTTVSCSENVLFPSNSDSFITHDKKTKKKRKKLNNSGLLMIEPVAEFNERKNPPPTEDSKIVDKKEEIEKSFDICMNTTSAYEVESSLNSETSGLSEKPIALNDSLLSGSLKSSIPSSGISCSQVCPGNPIYSLPNRVEEGTQTIKMEKRRKNKLNRKSKNRQPEEVKKKCDINSDGSLNVNIPDRLSFLEDQLMDVVDKVESMVAQSVIPGNIHESKVCDMKLEMKDSHLYCLGEEAKNQSIDECCGKRKNNGDIPNETKPLKRLKLLSKDEDVFGSKLLPSSPPISSNSHIENISLQSEVSTAFNAISNQHVGCDGSSVLTSSGETFSNNSSPCKKLNKVKDLPKAHKSIVDPRNIKVIASDVNIECNPLTNSADIAASSSQSPSCQVSVKDHSSGLDSCKSARHISIASLAWSSSIAKTSISRSCVTKSASNKVQTQVEATLRCESEHEFVKTVDSIVEELDQKMNRSQSSHISDKSTGLNEAKNFRDEVPKGDESYGIKNDGNGFNVDLNDKVMDEKDNSKLPRDGRLSVWSSNNSCQYQMPAGNTASDLQPKGPPINPNAAKHCLIAKENLNTQNSNMIMQVSRDHPSNIRNKNEHEVVLNEGVSKNLDLESFEESNNDNKYLSCSNETKDLNNSGCFKSESANVLDDAEKKTQNSFMNNPHNISKHSDGSSSMAFQSSRQKGQVKVEQHTAKNSRQHQEVNLSASGYYNMDESGKKFGYPNIFAPPIFTDPYSSSCAQFSTFPVSAGPSFEPSFMLPPCIPFDAPVASASFNYYGDSSRYSHFGHTSLATKPHSFSSITPEYPSCSLEPKKPLNSNFSNRSNKDDALKNKANNSRKDLFVSSDLPIDQFIVPCGSTNDKVNMSAGTDISHYGVTLMNPITSKAYTSKQDTQTHNRSKSSNTFLQARNSSNTLMSPPLHHHPLLFDQKNTTFATSFDFNSANLNTLVSGCNVMDQSFSSNASTSISSSYDRECITTSNNKNIISDDKKIQTNGKALQGNKMYDNSAITPKTIAPPMSIPLPTTSSNTQTKTTSKSRNSKKSTSAATKTNPDNNSCMFNQNQASQKPLANNEVMSYFSNNFSTGLTCRTAPSSIDASKFQSHYVPGSFSVNGNSNNLGLRTSANIGMDYMSTQILGSSGSIHSHHHHPHFGFNHFFPEMDIPNGYLKFGNPGELETMPLHHQHKNLHQSTGTNQSSVLSDINPFFHPPQYSFEGSSSYFNQSACSAGPFTMSSFNIRMPRMYHQNNNSF